MKQYLTFLLLILFSMGCSSPLEKETSKLPNELIDSIDLPTNSIEKSKLNFNKQTSIWTLNGQEFTGYALSIYPDSSLKQKIGVFEGRKQNESLDWYPDGHLKFMANYHKGKLHGEKKTWSSDSSHILISHLDYHLGKAHGEQKKWYATGEIFKILNLNMGKEEGLQRAYRKNGDLFANYEARGGRIFGLKRAALCYDVEDENVQYK